jgi:peroxiredoxin
MKETPMQFITTFLIATTVLAGAATAETLLEKAGSAIKGTAQSAAKTADEAIASTVEAGEEALDLTAVAKVGSAAPDFTGTTADGTAFTLSEQSGKIVVLEWTNYGCPFVKKHYGSGNMQKLQKEATAEGVVWVRVISSAEGKQGYLNGPDALAMAAEQEMAATATILDASGAIGRLYDAKTTPHMFVIDKDGVLQYAGAIDDDPGVDPAKTPKAENYVVAAIDALQAGSVPSVQETRSYGCSVKY